MGVLGYVFKQFACPVGVWTDIVTPIRCNTYFIRSVNGLVLRERTDSADANTEDLLQPDAQETVIAPGEPGNTTQVYRFAQGTTIISVQPQGVAPDVVIAKFIR